jgi:hypothetical protein
MLALALEKLDRNQSRDNVLDIRIYADYPADIDAVGWVRNFYYPSALIFQAKPHIEAPSGCWNILNSIKQGYETGADYIILLEEDVLVRPGFYEHHLNAINGQGVLASCGRKDPSHYPLYGPLYTNPCSMLRRELIEQLLPHICDDYFSNLGEYLDRHFESWPTQSQLDDGLIRRVIRQMGGHAAYPDKPVCAHQGFRLYGKLDLYMNQEVGIEKRIARLREIISKIRPGERYARDFEPF